MVADEYSTGGGGKLKLKGSKVSDGRVEKKKKSKKGKKKDAESEAKADDEKAKAQAQEQEQEFSRGDDDEAGTPEGQGGKTETERKYEEIRRKRLHERLQRDGIKTHKERVEELNTYLSRLSEHHDMPKIGPG